MNTSDPHCVSNKTTKAEEKYFMARPVSMAPPIDEGSKGKALVLFNPFEALMIDDDGADSSSRGPNNATPPLEIHDECSRLECARPES
ncbi:UNVERIFIED_CONTAM: hypothetical protein Slati_1477000 [Sesamum latifolium]|uniref:Uncharacterized protein n=1 Tax=Sesamum latifolium TaxID=2727402 RepID=A0AAW2X8F6_9LAMI